MTRSSSGLPAHHEIHVEAPGGGYTVMVGRDLLSRLPGLLDLHAPAHRYAVIADSTTGPLYGEAVVAACRRQGLLADLYTFPAGEVNKTRARWEALTDRILESGMGRDGTVVAVGGGVTGDLAGFVAATYMRGVPVVQVPTTVMAMVDSSVGGKTGVDVDAGKNLVGAFHPPALVVADVDTVATLSPAQRADGLAEAVKHGAIADRAYLDGLAARTRELLEGEAEAAVDAVAHSVRIKASVVSRDEREAGLRQVLNFGHTLGHALEAETGYTSGHGACVAAGMLLEAAVGERVGVTEPGTARELERILAGFGLGAPPPGPLDSDAVLRRLATDKKARRGRVRFALLQRLGWAAEGAGWSHEVDAEVVRAVLAQGAVSGGRPLGGSCK